MNGVKVLDFGLAKAMEPAGAMSAAPKRRARTVCVRLWRTEQVSQW
jgi:hypothetical protein